jgi:hypothetical protein
MSRIEDIFIRVRDTLGDPDKQRWDDPTLIRRLNEGQYDIAKKTELFKATAALRLVKGQYLYTMPQDFILLKEVMFAYVPLPVYPASQMSAIMGADWRLHTTEGNITAVVTDREDARTVRVYPRPFVDDLYTDYEVSPNSQGVTDQITNYDVDSLYGAVGSIYDSELVDLQLDTFGIIVDAVEGDFLSVEYVRRPVIATSIYQDPELPDAFDTALVKYVTGTVLRDDIENQNRAMGNEELTLYMNELADVEAIAKQSSTSVAYNTETAYQGMG